MKKYFIAMVVVSFLLAWGIISLAHAVDAPNIDALKWEQKALIYRQQAIEKEYAQNNTRLTEIAEVLKIEEAKVKKDEKKGDKK